MLGEFTGGLQIATCVMIIVATFTWFQALRASNKQIDMLAKEFWRLQMDIIKLSSQVNRLEMVQNINTTSEKINETLASLKAKE